MTVDEISALYVVGEQRLLDYSHRGNLAMLRRPDGSVLFDEQMVARYFRPRDVAAMSGPVVRATNMGVIGVARLGGPVEAAPRAEVPTLGARDARKRALRLAAVEPPAKKRAAG